MIESPHVVQRWVAPFNELPFKELPVSGRIAARPMAIKVRDLAKDLLNGRGDVSLGLGDDNHIIYIMDSPENGGYAGAEMVIEKWRPALEDPDSNDRDSSYAIYSNFVINRPNSSIGIKTVYSSGKVEYEFEPDPSHPETYEVNKEELEDLYLTLSQCRQYRFSPGLGF